MTSAPLVKLTGAPSQPTILYEAHNLTLPAGTGIATYARSLAAASRRLGFSPEAAIGVERTLPTADARLNEILAFDVVAPHEHVPYWHRMQRRYRDALGSPGGFRLFELERSGTVLGPVVDALRPFDRVFAGTRLIDVAMTHFRLYQRFMRVRLEQTPGLFHATQSAPLTVPGCPNIYTVHDIIPLRLPHTTLDDKQRYWRLMKTLVRQADHIVTVSEYSRRDLIQHLGADEARVTNTYQPVDLPPEHADMSEDEAANIVSSAYGLDPREYYLFCGAIEPKKNLARTLEAYAESGLRRPLIIAGSDGWLNDAELRRIGDRRFARVRQTPEGLRRERQVRRVRYVPRHHLVALIKAARALLFPSLYEGFGLPVLEAMVLGTPVITSTAASLPEIAGDAALLVDPYSCASIRQALISIDADADLRRELAKRGPQQAKKFSATAYDDRLRTLYQQF